MEKKQKVKLTNKGHETKKKSTKQLNQVFSGSCLTFLYLCLSLSLSVDFRLLVYVCTALMFVRLLVILII